MGTSGEWKCWPASENEVELLPRGKCEEKGRDTDTVPPFRSDGVFDNPRATRMIISDGAMPCELSSGSKVAPQATMSTFPYILS